MGRYGTALQDVKGLLRTHLGFFPDDDRPRVAEQVRFTDAQWDILSARLRSELVAAHVAYREASSVRDTDAARFAALRPVVSSQRRYFTLQQDLLARVDRIDARVLEDDVRAYLHQVGSLEPAVCAGHARDRTYSPL